MYFKCNDCGHIFEEGEEKKWIEPHGEELKGCPICFEGYEEVEICGVCGKRACKCGQDYCDECKIDTLKMFQTFMSSLSEGQKNILREEAEL